MNSIDARGRPHGPLATPARGWQLDLGGAGSGGAVTLLDPAGAGIHSAGVDLVEVARIRRAILRSGEPFVRRVFGERERAAVSREPDQRIAELAALFGVKESVVKAMGGMPLGGNYADICVDVPDSGSARAVRLTGELAHWARQHQVEVLAGSAPAGDGMLLSWALALARDAPATTAHTSGAHTSGAHTSGAHTSGAQTSGAQTSGAQTSGVLSASALSASAQTSGAHTSGAHTTGAHTTGAQTSGSLASEARSGEAASGPAGTGQPPPGQPETGEVRP